MYLINNSIIAGSYMSAMERINLRATRGSKQVIEQRVSPTGTTVSAFMLQQSYEKALSLIAQQQMIRLSAKDWEMLNERLELHPAQPMKNSRH